MQLNKKLLDNLIKQENNEIIDDKILDKSSKASVQSNDAQIKNKTSNSSTKTDDISSLKDYIFEKKIFKNSRMVEFIKNKIRLDSQERFSDKKTFKNDSKNNSKDNLSNSSLENFQKKQIEVHQLVKHQSLEQLPTSSIDDKTEKKKNDIVIYRLKIHLKKGQNLVIRDASGSSDPYVKIKYCNKTMYKSNTIFRNLNPIWNEEFAFLIKDSNFNLTFEVFDYDRFMADDFMGKATVDLSKLQFFKVHDLTLHLSKIDSDEYMGFINVAITIKPLTQEQKEIFLSNASRGIVSLTPKRLQKNFSIWLSTVNIILVQAKFYSFNFTQNQPFDVYVKFKLGNEKYKSKTIYQSFEPKWFEQFNLHIFDKNVLTLNVMMYNKSTNTVIGRLSLNLKHFEQEKTEKRWYELDNKLGKILLLTTISGISKLETVTDLLKFSPNRNQIIEKYSLKRSFFSLTDIGYLTVKVYKAEDLASADINGRSDPFCVLELVNVRLQTQTLYKTLNPEWNKIFTFLVKDIYENLEITVYDEDPNKKFEFLGKVVIPLLKIKNCERCWYTLRNRKLTNNVKGRILLEIDIVWNPIKAALRAFKPREKKIIVTEQKFDRQILVKSVNRLRDFAQIIIGVSEFYCSCLSWESYSKSITALIVFILFICFVELWHFPLIFVLIFLRFYYKNIFMRNYKKKCIESILKTNCSNNKNKKYETYESLKNLSEDNYDEYYEELVTKEETKNLIKDDKIKLTLSSSTSNDTKPNNDEKTLSIKQKFLAIHDTLTLIQNSLDFIASLLERIKNLFNFTIPLLSYAAIFIFLIAALLLYLIPLRWIILIWGINKFSKRLFNRHYIDNNELLDFLSRVPSDKEYKTYYKENLQSTDSNSLLFLKKLSNVENILNDANNFQELSDSKKSN